MAKVSIDQKNLAIALLVALILQYVDYWSLPGIGKGIILVVAILLMLK
jgi:hypothetical protein